MLQAEASERPFETVEALARDRLGMDPQRGIRTPETGGDHVFDNQFKAQAHEVSSSDAGSRIALCAGILRPMQARGSSGIVGRASAFL